WNVRRVVEENRVAVCQIVDVEPRREAPATKADDLLEAQVNLSVAVGEIRGPAVQRAWSDQVQVYEWTAGHRAADLLRDRGSERIRRGERQVGGQRTTELVGAGVVRGPVEDGAVAKDAANQHVDFRDDV